MGDLVMLGTASMFCLFVHAVIGALLNRMRGDGTWLKWFGLRGRALWYIAPAFGILALHENTVPEAVAWALAYLLWATPAWGRWYDLHRMDALPDEPMNFFERFIEAISFGSDYIALFFRHLLIVPGMLLVYLAGGSYIPLLCAVPAAMLFTVCYELGWRFSPKQPILAAEVMVGAVWGALITAI